MLAQFTSNETESVAWLAGQPAFKTFLGWLERSQSETDDQIYETLEPARSVLVGQAKCFGEIIKKCRQASDKRGVAAIHAAVRTPEGVF